MRKVAINRCYGGFGLSKTAILRYGELKGITIYHVPDKFCDSYYLCPPEEYEAVYAEDCKTPNGPGRFTASNALYFSVDDIPRDDPILIRVIEELGETANGPFAELKIVEIPESIEFEIDDYDGMESIHERHRSWS
jgi:hypothetical protein